MLHHPFNAFARSSDAMRASGLLPVTGPLPPNSGLRDNAEEGVPEAQIWGPLPVTSENVQAIIVEVGSLGCRTLPTSGQLPTTKGYGSLSGKSREGSRMMRVLPAPAQACLSSPTMGFYSSDAPVSPT